MLDVSGMSGLIGPPSRSRCGRQIMFKSEKKQALFVIEITRQCNFSCSYCSSHDRKQSTSQLGYDDLVSAAEKIYAAGFRDVFFQFYGGEPLLEWKLIERFVTEFRGLDWTFGAGLVTNGSHLTDDIVDRVSDLNIGLGISFDAPSEAHSKQRPFLSGKESCHIVKESISRAAHKIKALSILVTVVEPDYIEPALTELCELDIKYFALNPVRGNPQYITKEWCDRYAERHISLIERLLQINKSEPRIVNTNIKRAILSSLSDRYSYMCNSWPCGAGSKQFFIGADSNIYPCSELLDTRWKLVNFEGQSELNSRRRDKISDCEVCDVSDICGGGCPAASFAVFNTINKPDYLCAYYKKFFTYIKKLAQGSNTDIALLVNPWMAHGEIEKWKSLWNE